MTCRFRVRAQNFSFGGRVGAHPEAVYSLCLIINYNNKQNKIQNKNYKIKKNYAWFQNCYKKSCRWYYCKTTLFTSYLLTPWCRVLLEKLTGLQLVKKFAAFHGTRRFITALTSVRHLSLAWASPIQSIYPHPTSWRSFLILSTHLLLGLPIVYICNYIIQITIHSMTFSHNLNHKF